MTHVRRTILLSVILAIYLGSSVRSVVGGFLHHKAFDPFLPSARALEQRIEEGRFAEALPLARELDQAYPREAQVAFWLARIHHGLNDPAREAAAWDRYVEVSPAPDEACPAWPEAYARAGRQADSRRAADRCAAFEDADGSHPGDTQ